MDELPLEPYPLCQGIYSSQRSPTCIYCKGHVHPEITFETKNSEGELKSVGHLDSASNSDDSDEGDDKGNGSLLSVAPKPSKLPSNYSPVKKVP